MSNLASNLRALFRAYGPKTSEQAIKVMLAQDIESIEELNDCIQDELFYIQQLGEDKYFRGVTSPK